MQYSEPIKTQRVLVDSAKCGKMSVEESRLVSVLLLIG